MQVARARLRPTPSRPRTGCRRRPSRRRSRPARGARPARRRCRSRDRGSRRGVHGRADPDEVAQQREAFGRGLLGMALRAEDVAVLRRTRRTASRTPPCRARSPGRRAPRRTSARGRRPPGPAAPRRAPTAAARTRSSSRCAATSARACRAATIRPGSRPSPAEPSCSAEPSKSSCIPRHSPMTGTPARGALAHDLVEAERAQAAHRLGERADAGHDEPVGRAQLVVVGGLQRSASRRARTPSRPSGGCPSRSRPSRCSCGQRPLRRRHAGLRRVDRDRARAARARTP